MNETSTIVVEIKNVYGNELIYPVDQNAKWFAALAGKKTLSRWDLSVIKNLGYEVNVAQVVL